MNTVPSLLIAQTFVADRAMRYERAATTRRLVRRAQRERSHVGRDPDLRSAGVHTSGSATHLATVTVANGTIRSTGTASSPMASLPVDRVA